MDPDFGKDLLLITAASGKQASALLPLLAKKWKRLRLQCVTEKSQQRLQEQYPSAEVVRSDFASLDSAKHLLAGVSYVYLVTPGFHPREAQHGINMVDAATAQKREGGSFKFMLYASVLHSCLRAMANHDSKRYVEEALVESQLRYTIVQPTHLMDTVPLRMLVESQQESEEIVFQARFEPSTEFSFLSCHDLGEAVAQILADPAEHAYATYQLIGTERPMSYLEAMKIVSKVIGKPVRVERMGLDDAMSSFAGSVSQDSSENEASAMRFNQTRMLAHYESHGLVGNSKVLTMLLGRKPLGYSEWTELLLA